LFTRGELVDGVTKAGVLLWIESIPRLDELGSGAASRALKRGPEKDWGDDQEGVSEPMHAATPQVRFPVRRRFHDAVQPVEAACDDIDRHDRELARLDSASSSLVM
jgi:hypothetical protein